MEVPFIWKRKTWKTKAVRQVPSFDFSDDLWRCCWSWNRPRTLCQPQVTEVGMGTEQRPHIFQRSDSSAHNLHPPLRSLRRFLLHQGTGRKLNHNSPCPQCWRPARTGPEGGLTGSGRGAKERASLTCTHVFLSSSQPDKSPASHRYRQTDRHTCTLKTD